MINTLITLAIVALSIYCIKNIMSILFGSSVAVLGGIAAYRARKSVKVE